MRPICIISLLLISPSPLNSQAPAWLPEVTQWQSNHKPASLAVVPIPKFLSTEELKDYQRKVRDDWSTYLGAFEHTQPSKVTIRWRETVEHEPSLTRSLIEYETESGQWTEAFVLRPSGSSSPAKLPGVVVFHSTVNNSLYQPVGLVGPNSTGSADEVELRKAFALHLARRGYVTVSPRNYLWPTSIGISAGDEAEKFKQRQPQRKGMARMLLDGLLAVDVLLSLEDVDSQRIGAIGHSLGAKEVLYLAAFDARVKATVSSEGGIGIHQSNWDAPWYLDSGCSKPDFKMNHHQLLAAVAPRPFLLIGGNASDGVASLPFLHEALNAYTSSGEPENLGFYNHRQGHEVTELSLERSLEWLDWHLRQ